MTAFAGVVMRGQSRPQSGVAENILSYIVAPNCSQTQCFVDSFVDFAAFSSDVGADFLADDNLLIMACGRLDETDHRTGSVPGLGSRLGLAKRLALAYEKWGEALVHYVSGEFAFAIWDKQTRSLFCARDRFGQIPFAYKTTDEGIVFATDFISVAMEPSSRLVVNKTWIISFVNAVVLDEESTPFEGVKRLPPACSLTWRDGEHSIQKFWSFVDIEATEDEISSARLLKEVQGAVQRRLTESGHVTLLSGGLDSSSIAVLARDLVSENSQSTLPAISVVFDEFPEESERPYIECVLEQGGFEPYFVNAQPYNAVSEIERLVRVQGAPSHAISAPLSDQALAKLEQLGFSSVLDGHGGDEIISSRGTMRFIELAGNGAWFSLIRELLLFSRYSKFSLMGTFFALYALKGRGLTAKIARRMSAKLLASSAAFSADPLLKESLEAHPSLETANRLANRAKPYSHDNERSFQESVLSAPLQSHTFELLHRLFRSRGIRPQFPFWDQRVVALCIQIPSKQKLNNGLPRSLIRRVMGKRLPSEVAKRTTKFDFSDAHIRSFQSSIDEIQAVAGNKHHAAFEYIDRGVFLSAIKDLRHEEREVRTDAYRKVWTGLNLLLWFDMIQHYQSQREGPWEHTCQVS